MQKLSFFFCFLMLGQLGLAQQTEFTIYDNGLMYSSETMGQLKNIVTDLNLQFQSCELHKTYLAKSQTKGHYIDLEKGNIQKAKQDLENGISYEDFIAKYPQTKVKENQLIVRFSYESYDNEKIIEYSSIHPTRNSRDLRFEDNAENSRSDLKGQFKFKYWEKSEYSEESLSGFYFLKDFESQPLPEYYARMIQYSNCMVDTTATVFMENASRSSRWEQEEENETGPQTALEKFEAHLQGLEGFPNFPEYDDYGDDDSTYIKYAEARDLYYTQKEKILDKVLQEEGQTKQLFKAAIEETIKKGGHDGEFEYYVQQYSSKANALALKRNRIVVGNCSQDQSPRYHARDIAILSAETVNWEIFLRAHLDIMNDRFERASDGSYAWASRKTYLKELEELEINVPDLLMGISFRVDNPSQNHYYGNIRRLGRAMVDSKFMPELETMMLKAISDEKLDDYNRVIGYYLYANFIYNQSEEKLSDINQEKLRKAGEMLPPYLASKVGKKD